MSSAGYSGTPLIKKLGIKPGFRCKFVNQPVHYFKLLGELPVDLLINDGSRFDFVHVFITDDHQLPQFIADTRDQLEENGMIWVSWPKGKSKIPSNTNENRIREIALKTVFVDVKVCAVDDNWSGLKLVIRKEHRKALK